MIRRLFSAFAAAPIDAPRGLVPDGQRIYAVGDIHGRLDLLDDLLDRIAADERTRPVSAVSLIFLGDLIDRGPQSAQVVQRLLDLSRDHAGVRFLMGNHEEVFLKALAGEQGALSFFLRIGGDATMLSYGVEEAQLAGADPAALHALMQAHVPADHGAFIEKFEDMIVIGDYAFVHAGVSPRVPFARQSTSALRWVRDEFLNHGKALEKIVVHGHTISEDVEQAIHRVGLDTGAYASGRLTAMGFESDARWVIQTGA
ncbi:metallophosphoesterase [Sphingobium sp.]|uniref:metallophosphoesterase n=1 Tax=Sphingobium sp. TaxID=1912891 RepID=UPI003BB6F0BD